MEAQYLIFNELSETIFSIKNRLPYGEEEEFILFDSGEATSEIQKTSEFFSRFLC